MQKPESAPQLPFQPPSSLAAYELALQYRLNRKQSLEKALINVRSRLKGVPELSAQLACSSSLV